MANWVCTFTAQTWTEFHSAGAEFFGLPERQAKLAASTAPGDRLIAVLSGAKRVVGVLEVTGVHRHDESPIWTVAVLPERIPVRVVVQLQPTEGITFSECAPPRFKSGSDGGGWGVWMQQGLRRIGFSEDADRIASQLAKAVLNPVTVPLSDRELNYVPTFASRARRRWEDIRALVAEPNEEVPPSEIVRRALAAGIVEGTYPELVREAKHAGAAPPETTAATALAPTDPFGSQRLEFALSEHRAKVKEALVEAMHALEPYAFERLVLLVLEAVGLEDGVVTARSKDGGVDVRGMLRSVGVVRQPACVQVKRWKANVGRPDVQRLRGALAPNELGIMVTLSDFTKEARSDASSGPTGRSIYCMNGSQLANVMIESQVGVRRYNAVILEIDDLARLTQDSE